MKINLINLILFIVILLSCNNCQNKKEFPITKNYYDSNGEIDSIVIHYSDSLKIMTRRFDNQFDGVVYNKNKSMILSIGSYIILNEKTETPIFYTDGWFSKYNENGALIYDVELKHLGDSIYANQVKFYDLNGNIIKNKSVYYTLEYDNIDSLFNDKVKGRIKLHYDKNNNKSNLISILILSDKINSKFSNIRELTALKNIYGVRKLNDKEWTFEFEQKNLKGTEIIGFISFRDVLALPANHESTETKFDIKEKILFIKEKIN